MKKLGITLIVLLLFVQNAYPSVEFYEIEVDAFVEEYDNKYLLIFKPMDDWGAYKRINKNEKVILHIRFNPKCVTDLIQSTATEKDNESYLEAVNELKMQIAQSNKIILGLKSGKGFHPIPGKPGEYQSDNLAILNYQNIKRIYVIHSDTGDGYCE